MKEELQKYIDKLIKEVNKKDIERINLIRHQCIKPALYLNTIIEEKKAIIKDLQKIIENNK